MTLDILDLYSATQNCTLEELERICDEIVDRLAGFQAEDRDVELRRLRLMSVTIHAVVLSRLRKRLSGI